MFLLPAPRAQQFLEIDPDSLVLETKVGVNGKAHTMTLDQLIRFSAKRVGPLPH
jgi:hypothetical protein